MVAMPCGHLVCTADYQELGGYLGEKPKDEHRPSRRRARERSEERKERRVDPNRFMQQLNMFHMMGMPIFGVPSDDEEEDQGDEDEEDHDDDA
jgi:hypothetical protein